MTPRGLALLGGAVLVVVVGRLLGIPELYVVGAASAALVGVSALAARIASATIAARRATSKRLVVGGGGEVRLDLRNESRLPATLLLAEDRCHPSLAEPPRFVIPGLRPGRTLTLSYPITGTVRGRFRTGPLVVRVRDPFGLAERIRRYTAVNDVVVYPRIESLGPGPLRGLHLGTGASDNRRVYAEGDEFYTMREYVQGDDLRKVHWPSTAHRQALMVRQHEMPWQAQATVFLDTRAPLHVGTGAESTLEKAVSAAASVLWHLAERGYSLRLATEATDRPPGAEPWATLLDRLAELRPSSARSMAPALGNLREGSEGLLIAVLAPPPDRAGDLAATADVRALLSATRGYGSRAALIVCDRAHAGTAERAEMLSRTLAARGWRAATVPTGEPLATAWLALARARQRGSLHAVGADHDRAGAR